MESESAGDHLLSNLVQKSQNSVIVFRTAVRSRVLV